MDFRLLPTVLFTPMPTACTHIVGGHFPLTLIMCLEVPASLRPGANGISLGTVSDLGESRRCSPLVPYSL